MAMIPGDGTDVDKTNWLLEKVYNEIIMDMAIKHNFPIIDLSSSFDIYDESLFCCQIEPSVKGG